MSTRNQGTNVWRQQSIVIILDAAAVLGDKPHNAAFADQTQISSFLLFVSLFSCPAARRATIYIMRATIYKSWMPQYIYHESHNIYIMRVTIYKSWMPQYMQQQLVWSGCVRRWTDWCSFCSILYHSSSVIVCITIASLYLGSSGEQNERVRDRGVLLFTRTTDHSQCFTGWSQPRTISTVSAEVTMIQMRMVDNIEDLKGKVTL